MKNEIVMRAIGQIDDDMIRAADSGPAVNIKNRLLIKIASAAAAIVAVIGISASFGLLKPAQELILDKKYVYSVDSGSFSDYKGGRVIDENRIGEKIGDVDVTAGWKNAQGVSLTNEHLRAEIYEIKGISPDVAVAIKFIDKPEAMTTDHYYVIMDPEADLEPVKDYVIPEDKYGEPGPNGEIPE